MKGRPVGAWSVVNWESGRVRLKLKPDFRDMVNMLSPGVELVCMADTPDHSSETDPWTILHILP